MEESVEVVRLALSQERFSFDGTFFHIPEMSIRPRPRTPDLTENMFGTWASPDSMKYWASAGVGQMFVFATTWEATAAQANAFNATRAEQGWDPIQPLGCIYVYCAETEAQAQEVGRTCVGNVMAAGLDHYKLLQVPAVVKMFVDQSSDGPPPSEEQMRTSMIKGFTDAAVIGTPEQCREKMLTIQRMLNNAEYMCVFKYGAMPYDLAEQSMRLFAREVLPALHEIPATFPRATPFSQVRASRQAAALARSGS
jgi:alkanesulfonate monooxygenase SsuD/methylene tetrahydromethanopterin reductase-like flavin-dependent oxidoreductase (luciferase family)